MHESMTELQEWSKRHLVVLALVGLILTEALSLAVLVPAPSGPGLISSGIEEVATLVSEPILKISEIRGPRINDEAAMVVVADPAAEPICTDASGALCQTLPLSGWALLLFAYVALLVFNFSYTFRQAAQPQWFWEALYTLLAIVGWYVWDESRAALWFPFALVQFGLGLFALYAYLLEKKLSGGTGQTAPVL